MHTHNFLNSKDVKHLASLVEKQFGAPFPDDVFVILRRDGDVFLVNRDVQRVPFDSMNALAMGLYVGELRQDELRLSIEGAQLFGPQATRNVVDIDAAAKQDWFLGKDLPYEGDIRPNAYVILRSSSDYLGCGRVTHERVIQNFVPKARRVGAATT